MKEEELEPEQMESPFVEPIVDTLLTVYSPATDITEADELLSTATIADRLADVLPFEVLPEDVKTALNRAGFMLYNAGQMDLRWMLAAR